MCWCRPGTGSFFELGAFLTVTGQLHSLPNKIIILKYCDTATPQPPIVSITKSYIILLLHTQDGQKTYFCFQIKVPETHPKFLGHSPMALTENLTVFSVKFTSDFEV